MMHFKEDAFQCTHKPCISETAAHNLTSSSFCRLFQSSCAIISARLYCGMRDTSFFIRASLLAPLGAISRQYRSRMDTNQECSASGQLAVEKQRNRTVCVKYLAHET